MEINLMESSKSMLEHTPYLSVREFSKQYPSWTESSLRWLIYCNTSGFNDRVVKRIGAKKILLSVKAFWSWIEDQNSK